MSEFQRSAKLRELEPVLSLTIFANYFINSEERLLRLKDSFASFRGINPRRWVINIRGPYREKAGEFLLAEIGQDNLDLSFYQSRWGWFHDTRKLLPLLKTEYLLFWVEDHINLAPIDNYRAILEEMTTFKVDLLRYTWWCNGGMQQRYQGLKKEQGNHIEAFLVDESANEIVQKNSPGSYLIDIPCIFRTTCFRRIIQKRFDPILPRFSIATPFDFEKKPSDKHWLPLRKAIPKYELFASIDDDLGTSGYSLQARGLYPVRETRRIPIKQHVSMRRRVLKTLPQPMVSILFLFRRILYYF